MYISPLPTARYLACMLPLYILILYCFNSLISERDTNRKEMGVKKKREGENKRREAGGAGDQSD